MKRNILYLLVLLILGSCEDPEPLTAEDFVNKDLLALSNRKYYAEVDGYPFSTENIYAEFRNDRLLLMATKGDEVVSFTTSGIEQGVYFGDPFGRNQISYTDGSSAYGSLNVNQENNAEISILEFDEKNSLISGTFEATVYLSGSSKEQFVIDEGQFNDVYVNIPFLGNMYADLNKGLPFNSTFCNRYTSSNQSGTTEIINSSMNSDSIQLSFTIREPLSLKTYDLTDPIITFNYNSNTFSTNTFVTTYFAQSGSLVITEINTQEGIVKGNFYGNTQNFNGDVLNFQNGNFVAVTQ